MESFKELSKWSITLVGLEAAESLVKQAGSVGDSTQITALESQLCRCLRKDPGAQKEALTKYLSKYANVSQADVLPQLWQAAQTVLKGST